MKKSANENYADVAEGVRLVGVGLFGLVCNLIREVKNVLREHSKGRDAHSEKDKENKTVEENGDEGKGEEGKPGENG